MEGELTIEILLDVIDALLIACLSEVLLVSAGVLVEQELTSGQVLPCFRAHRRRNAFTASLLHLQQHSTKYYTIVYNYNIIFFFKFITSITTKHITLYRQ